jgi:tRNA nucleotidyltransferase/poly(A) polymerase
LLRLSKERVRDEILNFISCLKSSKVIKVLSVPTFFDVIGLKVNDFVHINNLNKIKDNIDFDISIIFEFALALDKNEEIISHLTMMRDLKFNKENIKFITEVLSFKVCNKIEIERSINLTIYKYGIEITKYMVINSWIWENNSYELNDWKNLFKSIDDRNKLVFPIKPNDLINIGVPQGPKIGSLLNYLEEVWIGNNCDSSKEELIQLIERYLPTHNRGKGGQD